MMYKKICFDCAKELYELKGTEKDYAVHLGKCDRCYENKKILSLKISGDNNSNFRSRSLEEIKKSIQTREVDTAERDKKRFQNLVIITNPLLQEIEEEEDEEQADNYLFGF